MNIKNVNDLEQFLLLMAIAPLGMILIGLLGVNGCVDCVTPEDFALQNAFYRTALSNAGLFLWLSFIFWIPITAIYIMYRNDSSFILSGRRVGNYRTILGRLSRWYVIKRYHLERNFSVVESSAVGEPVGERKKTETFGSVCPHGIPPETCPACDYTDQACN